MVAMNRREWILGALLVGVIGGRRTPVHGAVSREALWLAPLRHRSGGHALAMLSADGTVREAFPLPDRAHDIAIAPDRSLAVVFARRPGRFGIAFAPRTGRMLAAFETAPDRHFYGHGAFSPDGRLLFATENAIATGDGVISVRDCAGGFREIAAWPSGGIGPHDLAISADGHYLVVANGGLRTHPDTGRMVLNRETMAPNITILARATGEIVERAALPADQRALSIRHLAVGADGAVLFAGQWQGRADDSPALVGRWSPGQPLTLLPLPEPVTAAMAGYAGDIAVSACGQRAAVSSPRGGVVVVIDSASGAVLGMDHVKDVCALAEAPRGTAPRFLATSGDGRAVVLGDPAAEVRGVRAADGWDNHCAGV